MSSIPSKLAELAIQESQQISQHVRELTIAMERLANTIASSVRVSHRNSQAALDIIDVSTSNLSETGRGILQFADDIGKDLNVNIRTLLESQEATEQQAAAKGIVDTQSEAIRALGTLMLEIVNKSNKPDNATNETTVASTSHSAQDTRPPMSPEAQAIADGFDRILGPDRMNDPRMSYGKIPAPRSPAEPGQ